MPRLILALPLLLALAAPAASQNGAPPTVSIALSSFHIAPSTIHLVAGQPVRLTFSNESGSGHDFTAPSFFATAKLLSGAVPGGEIELPAHGSTSITLVPAKGTYQAHCSHFGHKLLGMKATVVVD